MPEIEDRLTYLERRMAQLVGPPDDEARFLQEAEAARVDQIAWQAEFDQTMAGIDEKIGNIRRMREGI